MKSIDIKQLCQIAVFTAIIAVFAQIRIPMPGGVPLTLQTFAIMLSGIVLGAKRGVISTTVYVLLGTAGVPIFNGFTGGLTSTLGVTGGFIISFPLIALFAGIGIKKQSPLWLTSWLSAGVVVNYVFGIAMFCLVTKSGVSTAFAVLATFIPLDLFKVAITTVTARRIHYAMSRFW
jgi:biotin transport system substrate-specific component